MGHFVIHFHDEVIEMRSIGKRSLTAGFVALLLIFLGFGFSLPSGDPHGVRKQASALQLVQVRQPRSIFLQNAFLLPVTSIIGVLCGGIAQPMYGSATPSSGVYVSAVFTSAQDFMLESGEPGRRKAVVYIGAESIGRR